jgi:hypothetical protein
LASGALAKRRTEITVINNPIEKLLFLPALIAYSAMTLSRERKELQPGGAGGRHTKDRGNGLAWSLDNDDSKDSNPVTPNITGNRLVSVEELTSIGTISSCCSSAGGSTTETALDDFAAYLQENTGTMNGITAQQHLQNWKEGRGKELLDCNSMRKMPFMLHESRTGIASTFSWQRDGGDEYHDRDIWLIPKKMMHGKRDTSHHSKFPARAADFEENVRLVISMQMNGAGGEEAAALLGMLNVPGGARMRHTHFTAIEQELAKVEINVAQEAIRAGLDEEIKRTVNATMDLSYEEWVALPIKSRPRVGLAVSFDAGWQKRSSGNTYDSLSGHAAFYGQQTRLVIALAIMSKRCTTCDKAHELERKVPEHNCPKNHEGSSKSMEPLAAVKLLKFIFYNSHSYVRLMVMDDDSSTVANCRHSYAEKIKAGIMTAEEWPRTDSGSKKKDAGLLPLEVPEPDNAADPTHRAKCVASKVFSLQKIHGRKGTDVTNIDANRIKLYWGHWQKQSRNLPFDEFKRKSNAVVDHLFDDHTFCSDEWCPVLKAQAKQCEYKGVYRNKVKHAREYEQIKTALASSLRLTKE